MTDRLFGHIEFNQAYIQNLVIEQKTLPAAEPLTDHPTTPIPTFSRPPNPVPPPSAPSPTPVTSNPPSDRSQPHVAHAQRTTTSTVADPTELVLEELCHSLADDLWGVFQNHRLPMILSDHALQTLVFQFTAAIRTEVERTATPASNNHHHHPPSTRLSAHHGHVPVPAPPAQMPPATPPAYYHPVPRQHREMPASSRSPTRRSLSSLSLQLNELPSPLTQPSYPTDPLSLPAYHVIPASPVWPFSPPYVPHPSMMRGTSNSPDVSVSIGSRYRLAPPNREHHRSASANHTFPLTASASSLSPLAPRRRFQRLPFVPVSPTPAPRRRPPPTQYTNLWDNRFPVCED